MESAWESHVAHENAIPMLQSINAFVKLKSDSIGDPNIWSGAKLELESLATTLDVGHRDQVSMYWKQQVSACKEQYQTAKTILSTATMDRSGRINWLSEDLVG